MSNLKYKVLLFIALPAFLIAGLLGTYATASALIPTPDGGGFGRSRC